MLRLLVTTLSNKYSQLFKKKNEVNHMKMYKNLKELQSKHHILKKKKQIKMKISKTK